MKQLKKEAFARDIDTKRMTVRYSEYGPKNEVGIRWIIDFSRRGASEITPGQWGRGYIVIVDPISGAVVEGSGYKR